MNIANSSGSTYRTFAFVGPPTPPVASPIGQRTISPRTDETVENRPANPDEEAESISVGVEEPRTRPIILTHVFPSEANQAPSGFPTPMPSRLGASRPPDGGLQPGRPRPGATSVTTSDDSPRPQTAPRSFSPDTPHGFLNEERPMTNLPHIFMQGGSLLPPPTMPIPFMSSSQRSSQATATGRQPPANIRDSSFPTFSIPDPVPGMAGAGRPYGGAPNLTVPCPPRTSSMPDEPPHYIPFWSKDGDPASTTREL